MAHNTHPSAPDLLCTDLLQRLQFAILEHVTGTEFRIIGHPPAWLFTLYPDARHNRQLSVDARTPVLQNFLADAADAWQTDGDDIAHSGFWSEQTAAEEPWHFHAMALRHGPSRLLLIQQSTAAYDQQATLLQRARDQVLQQHEHNRGHQRTKHELTTKLVDMERSRDDVAVILQQLGLATLLIDQQGQVRFLSASAARLLDTPATGGPNGLLWETLLPPTKPDRLALQSMLQHPAPRRERVQCHVETQAGRHLWLEIELQDDPRDTGTKIIFLHDMTDVHHLRRLLELKAHYHDLVGKAIIVAEGEIGGMPAVVAAFNFDFMGGSMGAAVGEGIVRAAETAVAKNAALIAIPASGGARMQEGMVSLIQLPRSVIAVRMVKDAGLPYIGLLTDPTTGGVSASFAMLGDIHMAEPGCMIGFAGKRVIEETIREQLPAGFQTAEYLRDHGMADMVVARKDLKESMGRVLNLLMNRTGTLNKQGNGGTASSGKANGGKAGLFAGRTAFAPHTTVNQLTPANDPVDVAPTPANVSKRASKK